MTQHQYASQRAKLLKEFCFLKSQRLFLSAKARIRRIAQLDFEYDGTPIEKTKRIFNYDNLNKEK